MDPTPIQTDFNIVHPVHFAERGYPHDVWTRLRREAPVYWWKQDPASGGGDFWVITKHADITELSTQPEKFVSGEGLVISHTAQDLTSRRPSSSWTLPNTWPGGGC